MRPQECIVAVYMQNAGFSVYKTLKTILTVFYGWIVGVNKLAFNKLNRQRGFPYKKEQQLSIYKHIKVKNFNSTILQKAL